MIGLAEAQRYWDVPVKAAAWLTGVVGMFLIKPPRLWHSTSGLAETGDPSQWLHLSQFALAVIVGLFFVRSPTAGTRRRLRYFALGGLLTGIGLFIVIQFLTPSWTCGYLNEIVVIGETYTDLAREQLSSRPSCARLIGLAHGETADLWASQEIVRRYVIIAGIYTLAMLAFSVSVLATIDHIRATQKRPRKGQAS
jgi:hypothetical protein